QYDGATNAEGARRTFSLLPASHLIYVPGEMTHGVYPYEDDCVDLAVARFLLNQSPTQRELSCPTAPLPEDLEQTAGLPRTSLGLQHTYANPERARAIIARLKSQLGRAWIAPPAAP
ncbi:MAG: alpha/beta hydrolase, partial [Pigmentiphaga sp.]